MGDIINGENIEKCSIFKVLVFIKALFQERSFKKQWVTQDLNQGYTYLAVVLENLPYIFCSFIMKSDAKQEKLVLPLWPIHEYYMIGQTGQLNAC